MIGTVGRSPIVARIVRDAADLIREHGWRQGLTDKADPRLTLVEALTCAVAGYPPLGDLTPDQSRRYRATRQAVLDATGAHTLTAWNNTQGRTEEQVLKLLGDIAYLSGPALRVVDGEDEL